MLERFLVVIAATISIAFSSSAVAINFDPNSHIVVMKPHVNARDVHNLAEHLQASHLDQAKPSFKGFISKRLENLKMLVIEAPSEEALSFLKSHGDVAFTEQNKEVHIDPIERIQSSAPHQQPPGVHKGKFRENRRKLRSGKIDTTAADTLYYYWGLDRIDQEQAIVAPLPLYSTYPDASYIYEAPEETNAGDNVAVYVLDTGIDTNHNEFQNNPNRVVQNVWNPYGPLTANTDGDGHGTHCAGTIGGYEAGVAPSADLFGVKVLSDDGSGSWINILGGVDYVVGLKKASPDTPMVISMSLGGNCGSNCESSSINTGVDVAADAGIAVVVAAGNDDVDACWAVPASASKVITVGATTSSDSRSYFSNYGRCLEIFAPGSDIISACSDGTNGCVGELTYVAFSGTSMAAPHVSGVVALMLAQTGQTSVTFTEVKDLLECNAAVNKVIDAEIDSPNLLLQLAPVDQSNFTCGPVEGEDDFYSDDFYTDDGFYSSDDFVLFAALGPNACAEDLYYGTAAITTSGSSNGYPYYLSTTAVQEAHSEWLQIVTDSSNNELFRVFWTFTSGEKTMADRFENAVTVGEIVDFLVVHPTQGEYTYTGITWRFSGAAGDMASRFATSSAYNYGFSDDDGLWGAASTTIDGDSCTLPSNAWGLGNGCGGDASCGTVYVNGAVVTSIGKSFMYAKSQSVHTTFPTEAPSGPSATPTAAPFDPSESPTEAPSGPPLAACGSVVDAADYFQPCLIDACFDDEIVATTCSDGGYCAGDTYLRLYDTTYSALLSYNDDTCGLCSELTWTVSITGCSSYILEPACWGGGGSCGGQISITVAQPPTTTPSFHPTTAMPSFEPTKMPSIQPTTTMPSIHPTTAVPSCEPTARPSIRPTTAMPSNQPTAVPTTAPSVGSTSSGTTSTTTTTTTILPTLAPTTSISTVVTIQLSINAYNMTAQDFDSGAQEAFKIVVVNMLSNGSTDALAVFRVEITDFDRRSRGRALLGVQHVRPLADTHVATTEQEGEESSTNVSTTSATTLRIDFSVSAILEQIDMESSQALENHVINLINNADLQKFTNDFIAEAINQGSLTITVESAASMGFSSPVIENVSQEVVSTEAPTAAPTVSSSSGASCTNENQRAVLAFLSTVATATVLSFF